jgi:hypothetical protein
MRNLLGLLAICTAGYAVDHWAELTHQPVAAPAGPAHELILYGAKSSGAFVQLDRDLTKRGIVHEEKDLSDEANFRELTEKLARIGKVGGQIAIPVAEVDGVLMEDATLEKVSKKLR